MYLESIVSLVMHIASGSALEMLICVFVLFCTCPVICLVRHVLVFVLCEHFCLVSMCSHVYCLDHTHLVTSLLVQFSHLLSLIASSFALYLFSLCLLSCASSSLYVLWLGPDPALPFPAQPVKFPAEFFPHRVGFVVCFGFINKITSSALINTLHLYSTFLGTQNTLHRKGGNLLIHHQCAAST